MHKSSLKNKIKLLPEPLARAIFRDHSTQDGSQQSASRCRKLLINSALIPAIPKIYKLYNYGFLSYSTSQPFFPLFYSIFIIFPRKTQLEEDVQPHAKIL